MYVKEYLHHRQVRFRTLLHRPASSAAKLAQSVHIPGRAVAKTVLLRAGDAHVLAVLPSIRRIDMERLGSALGIDPCRLHLASNRELDTVFHDCEPGTVPPFGRLYGLRTIVDASLVDLEEVAFGTNTRHEGIVMRFYDYEAVEEPLRASFAVPIDDRPGRDRLDEGHRRAG